jgi:hypothetical protein
MLDPDWGEATIHQKLTIVDQFAIAAMREIIPISLNLHGPKEGQEVLMKQIAEAAYMQARAMLKAREA